MKTFSAHMRWFILIGCLISSVNLIESIQSPLVAAGISATACSVAGYVAVMVMGAFGKIGAFDQPGREKCDTRIMMGALALLAAFTSVNAEYVMFMMIGGGLLLAALMRWFRTQALVSDYCLGQEWALVPPVLGMMAVSFIIDLGVPIVGWRVVYWIAITIGVSYGLGRVIDHGVRSYAAVRRRVDALESTATAQKT